MEYWGHRQVDFAHRRGKLGYVRARTQPLARRNRAVRDYDLNTFLIRADRLGDIEARPPGMSVWMRQHW